MLRFEDVQGLRYFCRPCALGGEGATWIQRKHRTYLPPGRELCQMAPFCLARISSAFEWRAALRISSSGNRSWKWSYFPSTSRSSLGGSCCCPRITQPGLLLPLSARFCVPAARPQGLRAKSGNNRCFGKKAFGEAGHP